MAEEQSSAREVAQRAGSADAQAAGARRHRPAISHIASSCMKQYIYYQAYQGTQQTR